MYQDRETLGQCLRRERESHRVPVEEIALFVGVDRALVDALERDDFDLFPGRRECMRLVKQITAYLKVNQAEMLRLFDGQWKLTGGAKRYPKLTHYADADASPARSALFKVRRRLRRLPASAIAVGIAAVGVLAALSLLFLDLPGMKQGETPPDHWPPGTGSEALAVRAPSPPPAAVTEERIAPTDRAQRPQAPLPAPGIAERKVPTPPKGVRVIGNRDSKRYHLPGMRYYDQVKEYHRVVFASEKEAIRAGYRKARE